MISSYRLGDLVLLQCLHINEVNEIVKEHPNSIGSKYILEKRKNNFECDIHNIKKEYANNIHIITKIVVEYIEQNLDFLPKDITESTVIHVRLGDVIAGNEDHEKIKRPLAIDYMKSIVSNDTNKKYVIGKCFFAKTSSTNYEECIQLSNEYLHNVINELQAEYFNSGNADIDLCCAVKSKLFIQGKGFFSKLIVEIRKKLNLKSIETTTYD